MITGIKVLQKLTRRMGEIVKIENYIGDKDGRIYIKFDDNGEEKRFEFPGKFFNFFKVESETDNQTVLEFIETKKREFQEERKKEKLLQAEKEEKERLDAERKRLEEEELEKQIRAALKDTFVKRGHNINSKTPFRYASINSAKEVYWTTPTKKDVTKKWYLVLRDQKNKILRLFLIDATDPRVLAVMQRLAVKSDNPEIVHIEIAVNDPKFTDIKSKVEFRPYLIDEVNY